MKKIIALVVAVLMLAAIAVPAFAKDFDSTSNIENAGTDFNQSIVELGVSGGYTITIPVSIDFDPTTLQGETTITASSVKIPGDETLSVSISSEQWQFDEADAWVLKEIAGKSTPVDYQIYTTAVAEGNKVVNNGVILTVSAEDALTDLDDVTSGFKDSIVLKLTTNGTSQVGTYQDVLTFAVAIA